MIGREFVQLLQLHCIQLSVVAVVVWALHRAFAKNRPHLAHAMWSLVLLKCVLPPVWTSPTSVFAWTGLDRTASAWMQDSSSVPELGASVSGETHISHSSVALDPRADSAEASTLLSSVTSVEPSVDALVSGASNRRLGEGSLWSGVMCIWLSGTILCIAWTVTRMVIFLRAIGRYAQARDRQAERQLDELANELGIRRNVRLRIIDGPIGPAVMGYLRPVVLMPLAVVKGKTEQQLRPLLAHELLHLRRGDLFWAMLQSVCKCLWWMHPMVWVADRMLTREAERSCDEETIASLGCNPAQYANSLLDVLELKSSLYVAPALPGVRPVEITQSRLERIMRLKDHGSYRRTPRWIRLGTLVAALCVLPGAAVVSAIAQQTTVPIESAKEWERIPSSEPYIVTYDVQQLLNRFAGEGFEGNAGVKKLEEFLPASPHPIAGEAVKSDAGIEGQIQLDSGRYRIHQGKLVMSGTKKEHALVEDILDSLRDYGVEQILIEVSVVEMPAKSFEKLKGNWQLAASRAGSIPAAVPQKNPKPGPIPAAPAAQRYRRAKDLKSSQTAATGAVDRIASVATLTEPKNAVDVESSLTIPIVRQASATTEIRKHRPLMFCMVPQKQYDQWNKMIEADHQMQVLSRPTLATLNGREARLEIGGIVPLVKPAKQPAPIREDQIVKIGLEMKLLPTVKDNRYVNLDLSMIQRELLGMQHVTLPTEQGPPVEVGVPEISASTVHTTMNVPLDATFGLATDLVRNKKTLKCVYLFNCKLIKDNDVPAPRPPIKPAPAPSVQDLSSRTLAIGPLRLECKRLQAETEGTDKRIIASDAMIICLRGENESRIQAERAEILMSVEKGGTEFVPQLMRLSGNVTIKEAGATITAREVVLSGEKLRLLEATEVQIGPGEGR